MPVEACWIAAILPHMTIMRTPHGYHVWIGRAFWLSVILGIVGVIGTALA
jgi:hypothetical protein